MEPNKLPTLNGHDVAQSQKTTLPPSTGARESVTPIERTPTMVQREVNMSYFARMKLIKLQRPMSAAPTGYIDQTLPRLEPSAYMPRRHVPSRKSKIWDFFTPQDEEWCVEIGVEKIQRKQQKRRCVCNTCEKTFKISTTANLQKHLISRHPVEAEVRLEFPTHNIFIL